MVNFLMREPSAFRAAGGSVMPSERDAPLSDARGALARIARSRGAPCCRAYAEWATDGAGEDGRTQPRSPLRGGFAASPYTIGARRARLDLRRIICRRIARERSSARSTILRSAPCQPAPLCRSDVAPNRDRRYTCGDATNVSHFAPQALPTGRPRKRARDRQITVGARTKPPAIAGEGNAAARARQWEPPRSFGGSRESGDQANAPSASRESAPRHMPPQASRALRRRGP